MSITPRAPRLPSTLPIASILALVLGACGDDTTEESAGTSSTSASTSSAATTTSASTSTAATTSSSSGAGGGGGQGGGGGSGGTIEIGSIALEPLDGDLDQPIYGGADPAEPDVLYLAEKVGRIRRVERGVLAEEAFLDISASIDPPGPGAEEGLLSFALAPDFSTSGLFYVFVADTAVDDIIVTEYARSEVDPTVADAASAREVMRFPIAPGNHIAGAMVFGPDGLLYIAMGDGASAGNLGLKFGKILRIDPATYPTPVPGNMTGKGVDPDIFHTGFHNPWRISFDRDEGTLFIADVGLNPPFEEVNRWDVADGPADFGYPRMSGFECSDPPCDDLVEPILAYAHEASRCAIMGGYIYRGEALPDLQGRYVFADLCSGEVFSMAADASSPADLLPLTPGSIDPADVPQQPVGFVEDGDGELWIIGIDGPVAKLVPGG